RGAGSRRAASASAGPSRLAPSGPGPTPSGPPGLSSTAFNAVTRATRQLTSLGEGSMDNASAAMSVKPPTKPMLGATAQLTAQVPIIDGLRLKARAAAEAKAKVQPDN